MPECELPPLVEVQGRPAAEVHERSLDIDFILLLMKQSLLRRATRARLVVMSATLQAQVFVDYFQEVLAMDRPPVGPPTP